MNYKMIPFTVAFSLGLFSALILQAARVSDHMVSLRFSVIALILFSLGMLSCVPTAKNLQIWLAPTLSFCLGLGFLFEVMALLFLAHY